MGSYTKARGRGKPNFVMLRHDVMDSPAYRILKPAVRCVLHEIARRYNGNNNGEIPLGCRDAAILTNVSKDTASRAFKRLVEVGFIKENKDNYFYVVNKKSRRWYLNYEPADGRRTPLNEWKKFDPQSDEKDKHISSEGRK